jgi:hypothetical protein
MTYRLAAAAVCFAACTPSANIDWVGEVRFVHGDAAEFARPEYDDSRWTQAVFPLLPAPERVLWVRTRVRLPPSAQPQAVFVGALASHEAFWDGVLIGRGGVVGDASAAEVPGPIEAHHRIPEALAGPGVHVLAMRTSAFHRGFAPQTGYWGLGVGTYDDVLLHRWRGTWIALISLSGILLGTLIAFATFALDRRDRSPLLLGLAGLAAAPLLGVEAWRPLAGYPYDWHVVRLAVLCVLSAAVQLLLIAYLARRFPHRRSNRFVALAVPALAIPTLGFPSWNDKLAFLHLVGLLLAAGWTAAAWRRRGAWPALAGIAIALALLVADRNAFLDRWLYFALDGLFALLLIGHLVEWRDALLVRERAVARSARLEAELLKRHLQPHFVMNTLTAIGGWIEEDPPTAVRMIDSLADELRTLAQVSDRPLIALDDELRLCRAHLETMSLRRDVAYRLDTEGTDGSERVPPALIHTLVENAVTHGPVTGTVAFRLSATHRDGRTRLSFASPRGDDAPAAAAPGTGTRYLEARLREAWGDDWSLDQRAVGTDWRVEIDVPRSAR